MPVTARLSKAFYDRFGEQLTNELVEWFNAVDQTYRNDLRALNDANFARFEAVLEARLSQSELRLERSLRDFREEMVTRFLQQLRWMIGLWMTTTVGILAVLVALLQRSA